MSRDRDADSVTRALRAGVRRELESNVALHIDVGVARLETGSGDLPKFDDDDVALEIADDYVIEDTSIDADEYDTEAAEDKDQKEAEEDKDDGDGCSAWLRAEGEASAARQRAAKRRRQEDLYVALRPEHGRGGGAAEPTLRQRFKNWLGVRPGEQQRVLEAEVRTEHPEWSDRRVEGEARVRLKQLEGEKKAVHERQVKDDKVARILMRAHLSSNDAAALELLRDYERQRVTDEARGDSAEVERRMAEFETALDACRRAVQQTRSQTPEEATEMILQRTRALQSPASDLGERAAALAQPGGGGAAESGLGALNVNELVLSANTFVADYVADLSTGPDELCRHMIGDLSAQLLSAVSQTARLVETAPPDAVFFAKAEREDGGDSDRDSDSDSDMGADAPPLQRQGRATRSGTAAFAHPIDAMCEMLRRAGAHAIDGGAELDSEALTRYMHQWRRVQDESQADIDRELASRYCVQEFDALREALHKIGVSERDSASVAVCGVHPRHSAVVGAMVAFIESERFEEAREAARQVSYADTLARERRERRAERVASSRNGDADVDRHPMAAWMRRAALSVPVCARAYLRDFLRAPLENSEFGELPCINGDRCVCLRLGASFSTLGRGPDANGARRGFVARQFLLPEQKRALDLSGEQPKQQQMCLLCNRRTTSALFYEQQRQRRLVPQSATGIELHQTHGVLVDAVGEYDLSMCLSVTHDDAHLTGICKPFIAFNQAHYTYSTTVVHGERLPCVIESDVLDFRLRSASIPPI